MAASEGVVLSQMALGFRFMYGLGVPQSCEDALAYYRAAANSGNRESFKILLAFRRLSFVFFSSAV
jgi:TPR repeat protein